ncbi:hypothetical protein Lal_00017076 [Lupinus albus]|nr:hypothetical protein Lal_00017076 [Lupinus albus]
MKGADKALREFRTNYGKCLRDAEGNVNLKPAAKYAKLIDEADWIEFVNYRTKDEKLLVILEKALGLPQYPGRIRDAGFGDSKQFLTPSAKRLTKADAVVLQDKYDSLAKEFQAMEKRMKVGKFVEGPEGSTTMKESFTHPRNHIPIPEGIINNCKLFLDTPCTREVAIGMVYNTQDAIIHHTQIPSNHLKVSIDISIEDDALLPIPVDEDIITVGFTLATFVALPKHLIDVVPIMACISPEEWDILTDSRLSERTSPKREGQSFYQDFIWKSRLSEKGLAWARLGERWLT